MTTLPGLLFVSLFAVILPLLDYAFFGPGFRRRAEADLARAKAWLYAWSIPSAWATVGIGAAIWVSQDRPWSALGFAVPQGWRLWVAVALVLLRAAYTVLGLVGPRRFPLRSIAGWHVWQYYLVKGAEWGVAMDIRTFGELLDFVETPRRTAGPFTKRGSQEGT